MVSKDKVYTKLLSYTLILSLIKSETA